MSAEVIELLQKADAAFRGAGSLTVEGMQKRLYEAGNAVYLAMRAAGVEPLPYR